MVAYNVHDGALTQLYLATSPEVQAKSIRGEYYIPIADRAPGSATGRRQDLQKDVMEWTLAELQRRGYELPAKYSSV